MRSETAMRDRLAELLAGGDFGNQTAFWGRQFDLGLARVDFAEGFGGLGIDASWQLAVDEELVSAGAPTVRPISGIGVGIAAPTIAAFGTDEQKRRYLRSIYTAEEIWCQLFSEPGAGSDLAGLATRAVQDGDSWIVNGQKVWTSLAHISDLAILVARTDPDVPKHRGLTYFVVDLRAPGVEVRPLRQLTGEAEFNEVYLNDVRLPADARIGELGSGWRVAMTTLANERQTWVKADVPRNSGFIGAAMDTWRDRGHADAARRDELVRLWCRAEAYRLHSVRAAAAVTTDGPGAEGSIGKIVRSELNKDITSFTLGLMGGEALLYSGYSLDRSDRHPFDVRDPQRVFLRVRANSIEAGTTEINKNIVAERVLGLPGDIRVDKNVPWSALKRN